MSPTNFRQHRDPSDISTEDDRPVPMWEKVVRSDPFGTEETVCNPGSPACNHTSAGTVWGHTGPTGATSTSRALAIGEWRRDGPMGTASTDTWLHSTVHLCTLSCTNWVTSLHQMGTAGT